MIHAPCKDCTSQYLGCHGKCEPYLEFVEKNKAEKEAIRKAKDRIYARKGYVSDSQFRNAGKRVNKVFKQHKK